MSLTAATRFNEVRKRWTRADCKELQDSGLWEREKLELVEGELISKKGKNWKHVGAA